MQNGINFTKKQPFLLKRQQKRDKTDQNLAETNKIGNLVFRIPLPKKAIQINNGF